MMIKKSNYPLFTNIYRDFYNIFPFLQLIAEMVKYQGGYLGINDTWTFQAHFKKKLKYPAPLSTAPYCFTTT